MNTSFIPTAENSVTLETWSNNDGMNNKSPIVCGRLDNVTQFYMTTCAVNCYIQWITGLSCPLGNRTKGRVPISQQYIVAREKLKRYNSIIITEMLQDTKYVTALERFFGVPGIADRKYQPWCEPESHYVNEKFPLEMKPETVKNLTVLNQFDILLYDEMKDCKPDENGDYNFPTWDANRFERNERIQMNYTEWTMKNRPTANRVILKHLRDQFDVDV